MANRKSIAERFWAKVRKTETCWIWTAGALRGGYGSFRFDDMRQAHRVSWELSHGPIPEKMWVLHHCDTPNCVRPDHLFLGTRTDNMRDMAQKGRTFNRYAGRTGCPRGHPYTAENLRRRKDGHRDCQICHNERRRRYYAAAKQRAAG